MKSILLLKAAKSVQVFTNNYSSKYPATDQRILLISANAGCYNMNRFPRFSLLHKFCHHSFEQPMNVFDLFLFILNACKLYSLLVISLGV